MGNLYIERLVDGLDLTAAQMQQAMQLIMTGHATDIQISAFLVALRMKGETVTEITAAASVMRDLSQKVMLDAKTLPYAVDTCGTGGDGLGTFNVSTAAAFVVAAAGGKVAKHGNRSVSSKTGSADVLEAAGVNLNLTPEQVVRCVQEIGVGFMFAVKHHAAMKHAIAVRRSLGIRTIFNLLGPLTNPAGVKNQVVGVFAKKWVRPIAEVLQQLGSAHVLVVHAEDGLDEISINAPTHVAELRNNTIVEYVITPEDFGIEHHALQCLQVHNAEQSLQLIEQAFSGEAPVAADMLALNAGAALYAANVAKTLKQGVHLAQDVLATGQAHEKFKQFIAFTQAFSPLHEGEGAR